MEVSLNPVLPPPPPPLPPIPLRKTANKTIPSKKTDDKMPTTTTTTETEKPDAAAAQMMKTFERRMQAMQDQMAERERHHAKQIEDLTRQLKSTTGHSETHRHSKKSRKPATVEEDNDTDTEVRQTLETDARRTREEASNAIARYRTILLKLTHAEHHLTNTEELTTSGLIPFWLQTDLEYNPMMETHTDVVSKCREREKSFKQGVLTDLLSHYRQVVDHMQREAREAEQHMEVKAKTLTNTSDKKSCSQTLQNAIGENTKMEGDLRKKRARKIWALKHQRPQQERPSKRQRTESTSSQQSGETCHTDESIPRCVRPNDTVCIPRKQHETPPTKYRRRIHRRERTKKKTTPNREDQTLLRRSGEHEHSVESVHIVKPLEHVKPREIDTVPRNKLVELCANEMTVSYRRRYGTR